MTNRYRLDLDSAWVRVLKQARQDFIPDILRFEDQKLSWSTDKARIEEELDAGTYHPALPTLVEVPKDALMSRPVTVMRLQDRVVYEAILEKLVDAVEGALPAEVFSSRIKRNRAGKLVEPHGVAQWLRFERAGLALHTDDRYQFMLTTDVSSYFEYVDIKTLIQDLKALPSLPGYVIDLLSGFLNHIERLSDIWGLPQGHSASSILGNFYLLPLDSYLRTLSVRHVRYQDDIRIFANTRSDLIRVLRGSIRLLRGRHLNFAVQKTRISHGAEILAEFEDSAKNAIQYGLQIGSPAVADELHGLFERATTDKLNARDIRFSIVRLAQLNDGYAVDWIVRHLDEAAFIASQLTDYLDHFIDSRPEIEDALRSLIGKPAADTYPYAVLHTVRLLYRASSIQNETHQVLWKILRDSSAPTYVREHVARCIGRHAKPADVALLKSVFTGTSDLGLRRALLVAVAEASQDRAKAWLGTIAAGDSELAATCKLLSSSTILPPP